ncbi:MAG: hypothetical protein ACO1SV_05560 [Fimbriimonas sp.]
MKRNLGWVLAVAGGFLVLFLAFFRVESPGSPVDRWIADPTGSLDPLRAYYQTVSVEEWVPLERARPTDREAGVAVWDRGRQDVVDRVSLSDTRDPGFLKKVAAEQGSSASDLTLHLTRDIEPRHLPRDFTGVVQTRAWDGSMISVILNDGHEVVTIYLMNGRIARIIRGHSDV